MNLKQTTLQGFFSSRDPVTTNNQGSAAGGSRENGSGGKRKREEGDQERKEGAGGAGESSNSVMGGGAKFGNGGSTDSPEKGQGEGGGNGGGRGRGGGSRGRGRGRGGGSFVFSEARQKRVQIARENKIFTESLVSGDPQLALSIGSAVCYPDTPKEKSEDAQTYSQKYYLKTWDTYTCAEYLVKHLKRPESEVCVLNMANANHPGGGYQSGASAQEEALCRRSTLFTHLIENRFWYPFGEAGGLWTPGVLVFRKEEKDQFEVLSPDERFTCGVVSVAAIPRPKLTDDEEYYASREQLELTIRKIETILAICKRNKQKYIVLGAFGCGAFRNPSRQMADLFLASLTSPRFKDAFKEVWLSILEISGSKNAEPWSQSWDSVLEKQDPLLPLS